MARFYPLYVRRSDGKIEIIVKGKRKELNQPTDDQLDQRADKEGISDFYREVALEEPKHMDWRRKLGGMLARELNWKDKTGGDNGYILVSFPENYRLYEHVKKTEKDGKAEVKSKTHAAGGNDRQDAYLYGHPDGRKKRFRSPNDFFPHLLWLCTDESGDPDNCTCKICTPEDVETVLPGVKLKMPERPVGQVQLPASMARQLSAQGMKQEPVPRPVSAAPKPNVPAPLPLAKTEDHRLDRRYNVFMYRPGELVWFKRGQAWGLGAILRRWLLQSGSNNSSHQYLVQPLSYPGHNPRPVIKSSDAEMRPWLAWSVPRFTNEGLNNLANPPRYDSADWRGMMEKRYGSGDMEVDGSILAAKTVDSTYTLFNHNRTIQPEALVQENHFDGIFLGAEKIWTGDPIRLHRTDRSTDIMVVHTIIDIKTVSAMNKNQILDQTVKLQGDMYTLTTVPHPNPAIPSPAAPNNNPHLPTRLTDDLAYRNARSIPAKRTASYWNLTHPNLRIDLNEIKGRWYEASLVLPILQPQLFEDAARRGEIQESSLWMNARGDCINSNRAPNLPRLQRVNVRKESRKEAFGRSVPPNVVILEGVRPPVPENVDPAGAGAGAGAGNVNVNTSTAMDIDPRFDTADDGGGGGQGQGQDDRGLEEFMNLDDEMFGGGGGTQSPFFKL
ncbi:hypothetical protein M409DRAFT_66954 [Zasmidium cellare ATCC 36951]|uniref:Cryptic loci regulator 2 N-terminal domain-containing protein n=1 Tax=Zasmidium cellare ATCC 36951 TaxID=1080233 RepID=A0A6A6CK33_ZASCE|nr:uncharacterized protein M409DRAFT_66954 [Zasmidium cellare ATCC 36951]KAF2166069.1 hypothetical protein M409DRAFT_66954 [Zasmidium cellare ATCC 36951]